MFCPKCGTSVGEETKVCPNCGLDFTCVKQDLVPTKDREESYLKSSESFKPNKKPTDFTVRFIYFGLAAVILVMFFIAASNIASGGKEVMQIQSVGGRTLEEAYYYELGSIYAGYAIITRALGIFFSSVLVWLGFKS